ncbi:IST1-like protein [Linum grandiflorum]
MGKKLDAILGRNNFKTYKFKALSNLAVSRLAIFKNQRQAKLNHAHSDVLELLRLGHRDRALLRVEHLIKEQNMLEVYGMMEDYCNLLVERVHLLEQERVCPDELKEAISSLLFASSRCGDFPELHEMRLVFTSRYGKDFAASAVELRNNCGVNRRMMQKMSTRQPDLETRTNLLREIASQNNIAFELDEPSPSSLTTAASKEKFNAISKDEEGEASTADEEFGRDGLTDSVRRRRKYKDVADAAQAAFKSAAYAAEAARAAVELSRSDPRHPGSSSHNSPKDDDYDDDGKRQLRSKYDDDMDSESEDEEADVEMKAGSEVKSSSSSLDPENLAKKLDKEIEINYSDDEETDNHQNTNVDEETDDQQNTNDVESDMLEEAAASADSSEQIPTVIQSGMKVESVDVFPNPQASRESRTTRTLNILKAPFSVRATRHVRGY